MLLIILLRRLSVRGRLIAGLALTLAGVMLIITSAVVAPGLLVHGVITVVVGLILLGSAAAGRRNAAVARRNAAAGPRGARLARRPDGGENENLGVRLVRGRR